MNTLSPTPGLKSAPSQRTRFRQWLHANGHDAQRLSHTEVDYLIVVFLEHERAASEALWNKVIKKSSTQESCEVDEKFWLGEQ